MALEDISEDDALAALLLEGEALLENHQDDPSKPYLHSASQKSEHDPRALMQKARDGVYYDFLAGCRIFVPGGALWRVVISDDVTGTILVEQETRQEAYILSEKYYYIAYKIQIWKNGEEIFHYKMDLKGKNVFISLELGGIGDNLAWLGHVEAFAKKHQSFVTCCVRDDILCLLPIEARKSAFLNYVTKDQVPALSYQAQYVIAVAFDDQKRVYQPNDYRQVGLVHMAAYILGLEAQERRPSLASQFLPAYVEKPKKPYICISLTASSFNKYWHYHEGWYLLVKFLKEKNYDIICLDKDIDFSKIDKGALLKEMVIDQTGPYPLSERAALLKNAEFFIGVSSGLSWLAWALNVPVVMISGFTESYNEFFTPYRVINRHVCYGCANNMSYILDPSDDFFCPKNKATAQIFECSKQISVYHVLKVMAPLLSV